MIAARIASSSFPLAIFNEFFRLLVLDFTENTEMLTSASLTFSYSSTTSFFAGTDKELVLFENQKKWNSLLIYGKQALARVLELCTRDQKSSSNEQNFTQR